VGCGLKAALVFRAYTHCTCMFALTSTTDGLSADDHVPYAGSFVNLLLIIIFCLATLHRMPYTLTAHC